MCGTDLQEIIKRIERNNEKKKTAQYLGRKPSSKTRSKPIKRHFKQILYGVFNLRCELAKSMRQKEIVRDMMSSANGGDSR